jgi:hypothetical protein
MRTLRRLSVPAVLEIPLTTCVYALCAALLGASLFIPALIVIWGVRRFLLHAFITGAPPSAGGVALLCMLVGASAFVFFFIALLLMGLAVRALSLPVRPGTHEPFSVSTIFWMTLNSIHTIAFRVILPLVPAGYFSTMYFRLTGCRIGKGVWLTTASLLDPYMISIGDGTVVGGDAVLSAHIFSNGRLFLAPIHIGKDCQIGAHALLCPGVTLGDGATVGIMAYVRKGRHIPPGAHVVSVGGLAVREVLRMETGRRPRTRVG